MRHRPDRAPLDTRRASFPSDMKGFPTGNSGCSVELPGWILAEIGRHTFNIVQVVRGSSAWVVSSRVQVGGRLAKYAGVLSIVGALILVGSTPSFAKSGKSTVLRSELAKFADCPTNVAHVATCLYSSTTSTTFEIDSTTVSSTSPTTLSFGIEYTTSGAPIVVLPDNGTPAMQAPAIPVPGGLSGISLLGSGELAVTATAQLVGLPTMNLGALLTGKGPGLTLPVDVLLGTPTGLLGDDCTLGDSAGPITLNLTTGTTSPPGPNTPITGSTGTLTSTNKGLLTISGLTLVDNAFAVPGAQNCGEDGLVDEPIDIQKGLPSPAGSNTAILSGSSYTAPASLVRRYLG